MTEVREHTFPFAGPDTLEGVPATEEAVAKGRNRTALIAAVVVGALVLVGAAYFLFLSGGSSSDSTSGAPLTHVTKPKVTAPKTGTAAKPAAPTGTKAFTQAVGKDPFKPLVVANTASTSGTGTSTGTTSTSSTSSSSTTSSTSTATTSTTGATTGTTTGTTAAPRSQTPISLSLLSVKADNSSASLKVNGRSTVVAVGATFATYFRVMALWDGKCGTFQYGDEAFNLCAGHSIRLQ